MSGTLMKRRAALLALTVIACVAGCRGETRIETAYGNVRGRSVNGTGAFAALLRDRGHEVRVARRLNDELSDWAQTIVRFAPEPGPIGSEEADWYYEWQDEVPGRRLIFVCRDGEAEREYWEAALASLPADAPQTQRDRIIEQLSRAEDWGSLPPPPGFEAADPTFWFGFDEGMGTTRACRSLDGPWAEGIDPAAAAIPAYRALELTDESEQALLIGEDRVLAMDWNWQSWEYGEPSAVLILANGSFLLNAALVKPARRPLALRVAEWAGSTPRQVAFVEGSSLLAADSPMPTPWDVIRQIPELGVVAAHFLAMALVAALAHAVILGRPRPAPPSDADRPRAHAEALGALLARLGTAGAARSLLKTYRRWRRPQVTDERHQSGRTGFS